MPGPDIKDFISFEGKELLMVTAPKVFCVGCKWASRKGNVAAHTFHFISWNTTRKRVIESKSFFDHYIPFSFNQKQNMTLILTNLPWWTVIKKIISIFSYFKSVRHWLLARRLLCRHLPGQVLWNEKMTSFTDTSPSKKMLQRNG